MCLLWASARLEQSVRRPASRGFCVAQAPEGHAMCKGVCALSEAAPHVPVWLANPLPAPRRLPPAAVPAAGVWRPAAGLRRPAPPGATCAAAHVTDLLQHFLSAYLWITGWALAWAEGSNVCASAAAGVRPAAPAGAAEAEPGLPGGLVRPAPVGTWLAFGFATARWLQELTRVALPFAARSLACGALPQFAAHSLAFPPSASSVVCAICRC
jgi:hypothetical protein